MKNTIIDVLSQVKEVLVSVGGSEFSELAPKHTKKIFDIVYNALPADWDADSDDETVSFVVDDIEDLEMVFFAPNDEYEDFGRRARSFYLDDEQDKNTLAAIDKWLSKLQEPISFLNYTPHDLTVYDSDKQNIILTVPSVKDDNGKPVFVRVNQSYQDVGEINDIPVVRSTFGDVTGLPDKQSNVKLIVSLMVAQALPNRDDLLVPDTNAGAVRSESGQIMGTTRFLTV